MQLSQSANIWLPLAVSLLTLTTEIIACRKQIDVALLVDSTASIGGLSFRYDVIPFLENLTSSFVIGQENVLVGLVEFTEKAEVIFCFNEHLSTAEVQEGIDDMSYLQGEGTNVADGLRKVRTELFTEHCGARKGTPKVLVLLTDGNPTLEKDQTIPEAEALRAENTTILAVGVGVSIDKKWLNKIAGGDGFVFIVGSFAELNDIVDELEALVCNPTMTTTASASTTSIAKNATPTATPATTTTAVPRPSSPTQTTIAATTMLPGFNPEENTCCCGTVISCPDGGCPDEESRCCGSMRYDHTVDSCCEGVITKGVPESCSRCCGTQAYCPRDAQVCCDGQLVSKDGHRDQCCGKNVFNPKSQLCCEGQVHSSADGARCCGSDVYIPSQQTCCNGVICPGPESSSQCCGTEAYDPKTTVCCGNYLSTNPYSHIKRSKMKCSSQENLVPTYRPSRETCCCGQVLQGKAKLTESCCGQQRYDLTSNLCCDGRVVQAVPHRDRCCRKEAYNPLTHSCCAGRVVVGIGLCCPGCDVTYKPGSQLCCQGKVFPRKKSSACCVNPVTLEVKTYSSRTEICCQGHVHRRTASRRCCGSRAYDTEDEMCCNSTVTYRPALRKFGVCDVSGRLGIYRPKHPYQPHGSSGEKASVRHHRQNTPASSKIQIKYQTYARVNTGKPEARKAAGSGHRQGIGFGKRHRRLRAGIPVSSRGRSKHPRN